MVQTKYLAFPIAVVTDASGECCKAHRILGLRHPDIMFLDCYAHQINLVVGDYFKSETLVLTFTDNATELISWLRGKTQILAAMRDVQARFGEAVAKAIIHAVIT